MVYFEREFLDDDDVEISCPECGRVLFSTSSEDDEVEDEKGLSDGAVSGEVARESTT